MDGAQVFVAEIPAAAERESEAKARAGAAAAAAAKGGVEALVEVTVPQGCKGGDRLRIGADGRVERVLFDRGGGGGHHMAGLSGVSNASLPAGSGMARGQGGEARSAPARAPPARPAAGGPLEMGWKALPVLPGLTPQGVDWEMSLHSREHAAYAAAEARRRVEELRRRTGGVRGALSAAALAERRAATLLHPPHDHGWSTSPRVWPRPAPPPPAQYRRYLVLPL